MVANVENMFSANGERPWHGIGTIISDNGAVSGDAIRLAGLDWNVELFPAQAIVDGQTVTAPDRFVTVRRDNNKALGVVGSRYTPLQNAQAFEFCDGVLAEAGAKYETAGSLGNGEKIWVMAQLPGQITVKGNDPADKFLLLTNTHDGSGAVMMTLTAVRVVCQNTLNIALRGSRNVFSIRHTASITNKIQLARQALGIAAKTYEEIGGFLNQLANINLDSTQVHNLAKIGFGYTPEVEEKDIPTRSRNNIITLEQLFTNGIGNDIPGVRGTAYALLNAATEYDSFHSGVRGADNATERRLEKVWYGIDTVQNRIAAPLLALAA